MIPIANQTAFFANMLTLGQRLRNARTAETGLTCTTRIDFHEQPTSIFRFVGQHVYERRPSGIVNRLAQPPTSKSFDIQIFDRNEAVCVNDLPRLFVVEVSPLISDVIMKPPKQQYGFASSVATLFPSRYAPLQPSQSPLGRAKPTRVFNPRSVAQSRERSQSNIDANSVRAVRQQVWLYVNGQQRKPPTRFPFNSQGLNCSLERSVQFDPHLTNLRETQFISGQRISDLAEGNTVVASDGAEPREPRFIARPDAAKESLESQIDSLQNVLQHLRMYLRNVFPFFLDLSQLERLVEVGNRLALTRPRFTSFGESRVVQFGAYCKMAVERLFLFRGGIDSIAKNFDHNLILPKGFSVGNAI